MSTAEATERPGTGAAGGGATYLGAAALQRLDLLKHLVTNSDRIPLVRGPAGVGKSTLMEQFLLRCEPAWRPCCITATPMMQPDQLLLALANNFAVTGTGERLIDLIASHFGDLQQAGRMPIILIDDAHTLPTASLITLLRLYERQPPGEATARVRILLFAQPSIDLLLRTPQILAMNLQVIQPIELRPLDRQQTGRMVTEMIQAEGLREQFQLSDGRIERLWRESGGMPGEIRRQVSNLLKPGPLRKRRGSASRWLPLLTDLSWPALVGGGAVALLLALTLLFQEQINALFQAPPEGLSQTPPDTGSERQLTLEIPDRKPPPIVPEAGPEAVEEPDPVREMPVSAPPQLTLPEVEVAVDDSPASGKSEAADQHREAVRLVPVAPLEMPAVTAESEGMPGQLTPLAGPPPAAGLADSGEPSLPQQSEAAAPVVDTDITTADTDSTATAEAEPAAPVEQPPAPAADIQPVTAADKPGDEHAAPVVEQSVQAAPKLKPAVTPPAARESSGSRITASNDAIRREPWLLQQPAGDYTLQLVGVQSEAAAIDFIKRHHLAAKAAYFHTQRNGSDWFSVVYDRYPDRAAAVAARAQLPGRLKRGDAWPRTFQSIQQLLDKTAR